jgi:glucose/arabinose dehydrogenase
LRHVARDFFLLAVAALVVTVSRPAGAAVPAGFVDEVVAAPGGSITGFAFTPDGRLLVTRQDGLLLVYPYLPTPALEIPVCSGSERGLLGVAVDPAFATNRFIYLYYTFPKGSGCPTFSPSVVNRVSRFVLSDANVVDPASERVLIDEIPSWAGNHNGGDLQFGRDGFLYVSVGDGGCDYAGDSGCGGTNDAARDQNVLLGKILRIAPAGATPAQRIPATNPFRGADSEPCALAGRTTTPGKLRCQETFAWGLRNPFRIAFDPASATGRFFINDVGQDLWEEIDQGVAGADYGWNCREGAHTNSTTGKCAGLPSSAFRDPIHEYGHGSGCEAITGGAFVPTGAWPAAYDGSYLFADYVCSRIFRLAPNGASSTFATLGGGVTALVFGPPGADDRLFYATHDGQIRRIRFGSDRRAPPLSWNGDSQPDLVWQDTTAGFLAAWFMSGSAAASAVLVTPPQVPTSWRIAGAGDFNADGKLDLVWQDLTTGVAVVWSMSGTTAIGVDLVPLPAVLVVAGVGDFDRDGRPDLVVREPTSGGLWIVYMNGVAPTRASFLGTAPATWALAGVADFDRDGAPDLLWQDLAGGVLGVSFVDDGSVVGFLPLRPAQVPVSWRLAGVADMNGDGQPDILWQERTTGALAVWYMNGLAATSAAPLTPAEVDPRWRIVLPR